MKRLAVLLSLSATVLLSACGVNASRVATQVATATVVTAASIALDAAICGDECAPVCEEDAETYDATRESTLGDAPMANYAPEEDEFGPRIDE